MFVKTIVLIVSILSLLLIYNFIRISLVYKNKQEVDQILTYLNKYLTTNYYAPPAIDSAYNNILVKSEYDYCKRSDLYKFYHPDIVMTDIARRKFLLNFQRIINKHTNDLTIQLLSLLAIQTANNNLQIFYQVLSLSKSPLQDLKFNLLASKKFFVQYRLNADFIKTNVSTSIMNFSNNIALYLQNCNKEFKGVIKDTLRSSYFDCIPKMYIKLKNTNIKTCYKILLVFSKHVLPEQLTLPFTYYDQLIKNFKVGQASLCLFQKYNHLPSRHVLSHKDNLMNNQYKYIDSLREKGIDQECINNATFIPKTYRLFQKQDCQEFFDYLNSNEYSDKITQEGPQFITKVGLEVHRGRGIKVLFPEETKKLQEKYKNGKRCGLDNSLLVAQQYIGNPMLYNNHKIEFRIYWVLASTYPIIAYAYDKTLIRRCIAPFDKFSLDKEAHVCNTAIVKSTLKQRGSDFDKNEEDDDESELYIDWKLDHLQDLLIQQGKIKDRKWLQNYLYPTVDRMIIHAIKSVEGQITRDSRLAEFFAADFILTDDLKIHIMEINYNPQTLKTTIARVKQHTKMTQDMIDIQNAYLRSKYLRFKKIILNILSKMKKQIKSLDQIITPKIIDEINEAYKDKLDQGIKLKDDNLFRLVMDENLPGTKKYKDLLQTKCL